MGVGMWCWGVGTQGVRRLSQDVSSQKYYVWKLLGLVRNPSKRNCLDESCRMVQATCHSVASIKRTDQITKVVARQNLTCFANCGRWLCVASRCNHYFGNL